MNLFRSKAINYVFVVVVVAALSACNTAPEQSATPEQVIEGPWSQQGDTYSYDAVYDRPNGVSEDVFEVTVDENGVVTSAQAVVEPDGGKHAEGLVRFNEALAGEIVGVSLDEVPEYDALGEYSLTTDAFNEAINELQAQVAATS